MRLQRVGYNWATNIHTHTHTHIKGLPRWHCKRRKSHGFSPCVGKIPWMRAWESYGQRSPVGLGWGCSPFFTTEETWHTHMHTHKNVCVYVCKNDYLFRVEFYTWNTWVRRYELFKVSSNTLISCLNERLSPIYTLRPTSLYLLHQWDECV